MRLCSQTPKYVDQICVESSNYERLVTEASKPGHKKLLSAFTVSDPKYLCQTKTQNFTKAQREHDHPIKKINETPLAMFSIKGLDGHYNSRIFNRQCINEHMIQWLDPEH